MKLAMLCNEPVFFCPGCKGLHRVNVNEPNSATGAKWKWNGDMQNPTFEPSINVVGVCHSFVRNGTIQFLGDCKHELANKSVPLPENPFDCF